MAQRETRRYPGGMSPRYRLFRRVMVALGALLFGFTVHGGERTPEKGPLVVASNHGRILDPVFVCMAVPRRLQWMAKQEAFVFPFRRFFAFIGAFPVDRGGGARAALSKALGFLSKGHALGIFPEGTRRREGASVQAKSGAVMLAVRGGARILPVHVGKVPTPAARLRGEKLRVHVGEPIFIDNTLRGGRAYREEADRVLGAIYALPEERPPEGEEPG